MSNKLFNAVAVITVMVLVATLGVSVYAFVSGATSYAEFISNWREPLAVCLGFWLRGGVDLGAKQ